MPIRVRSSATAQAIVEPTFEVVRERKLDVPPQATRARNKQLLASVPLSCDVPRRSTRCLDATRCLACPKFVNYVPSRDYRQVTIRCLWNDSDAVQGVMTTADRIVSVHPSIGVIEADEIARQRGIRHLVVCEDQEFLGIVCRCDLLPPVGSTETVADRMAACAWTVDSRATLGQVVATMAAKAVGVLPVVEDGLLQGLITRGDLRRLGIEEALLGASACAACGSSHGVTTHPRTGEVEFCLDCLDATREPIAYEELGAGD